MPSSAVPDRLHAYPMGRLDVPLEVRVATGFRARLAGLAGLAALAPGCGLLLPGARSVHTFGMRFALDLVWLDRDGRVRRVDCAVPPCRLRSCRPATGVLELAAGEAARAGLLAGDRIEPRRP